jgi:hypothetical protein
MDPQQPRDPQQPQDQPQPDQSPAGETQQGWAQSPPPQQGWAQSPPPQQGWAQGAGYYTAPPRPGGVTFAGIFLIVMGVLALLASLLLFMGGAMFDGLTGEMGDLSGMLSGLLTVFAVVVLVWGLLHLLGGVGALQGKGWGRATGIVVSVIAVILFVLGLLGTLGAADMEATGLGVNIVLLVLYGLTAWALIKAGPYFAARR